MARRCPDWVAREDLVSAGMLGLIEAADRYDGSRQEPFIAFAEHRIRGAVLDELRRGDIMPRRMRKLARKIAATAQALEKDGQAPSEDQMADALGMGRGRRAVMPTHRTETKSPSTPSRRRSTPCASWAARRR